MKKDIAAEIAKMSLKQLLALSVKVEKAKTEAAARERTEVIAKAQKWAAEKGMTLSDVFGKPSPGKAKQPRKPPAASKVIRHPTDRTLVYRGLGRKPSWLKKLEAAEQQTA